MNQVRKGVFKANARAQALAVIVMGVATTIASPELCSAADAPTASVGVLHTFDELNRGFSDSWARGADPETGVILGSDGNFYGTTNFGGDYGGTVFKMTPSRQFTVLYRFGTVPGDGGYPRGPLIEGSDGNFYGTTNYNAPQGGGPGTVFKITPSGTLTTLYTFGTVANDGAWPLSGVVEGTDGNFYGTTLSGGANDVGTIFKITPAGALTTLYAFGTVGGDGAYPSAGLVLASDGNFYGATGAGGAYNDGTIYKITPSGTLTTLYTFGEVAAAGAETIYALIQASDGNFYGTNLSGGTYNRGTAFKFTPSGYLTTLHAFSNAENDGYSVSGSLLEGRDGNFYGVTFAGGRHQYGTTFELTPSGSYTTLYSFAGTDADGQEPYGTLIQLGDGSFIGTAENAALETAGTIFEMKVTQPELPGKIASVTAQPGGQQAKLSWTVSANATSYTVLGSTLPGAERPIAGNLSTRRYTATNLVSGTTYYYKVVGVNPTGIGQESEETSFTPQ